ncbi:MAG: radical SAM protein [Nitrospirae bacterium]|nr:radical SAM protein [Nitrospirota bacterium]
MADILFVMPRFEGVNGEPVNPQTDPPLPFLWLGAVLEPKGYSIKIIDAGLHADAKSLIKKELDNKPIFIGFYGHLGRCVTSLIELSSFAKEYAPEIPVVHGGILPSMNPALTLNEPYVDVIVIGEGEATVIELTEALKNNLPLDDIKGIGFRKNGEMIITPERPLLDLNSLPVPSWHLIKDDIGNYLLPVGYHDDGRVINGLHLVSSKGCPAKCSFCFSNYYQKRYRCKSAEKTLEEVECLIKELGVRDFYYHDEDFLINKKRARELFKLIKERKLDIRFSCQTRVDTCDDDLLKEASAAGLIGLSFGVEFCTEDVLESYQKKISMEQVFKAAELSKKYKIFSHFNLIFGYPSEKYADMMTTVKVAEKLRKINPFSDFSLFAYTPNYGTPEFREIEDKYHFYPKKLKDCEWLHWSTLKNRKWIRHKALANNFYFLFRLYFANTGDITPAIYRNNLVKKWAELRLKGPFLSFAPELFVVNLIRKFYKKTAA